MATVMVAKMSGTLHSSTHPNPESHPSAWTYCCCNCGFKSWSL